MPDSSNATFYPFVRLPAELRERILRYHITGANLIFPRTSDTGALEHSLRTPPAILRVNRQIYIEAKPIFYDLPVTLCSYGAYSHYDGLFTDQESQRLRNVRLRVHFPSYGNHPAVDEINARHFDRSLDLPKLWKQSHSLRELHVYMCSYELTAKEMAWYASDMQRISGRANAFIRLLSQLRGFETVELTTSDEMFAPGFARWGDRLKWVMQQPKLKEDENLKEGEAAKESEAAFEREAAMKAMMECT